MRAEWRDRGAHALGWFTALVAFAVMALAGVASANEKPVRLDPAKVALALLDKLDAGDFDAAVDMFDDALRAALDAAKLRDVQRQIEAAGPLVRRDAPKVTSQGEMAVVTVRIVRGAAALNATVAVNASGRVSGLHFQNAPPEASVSNPQPRAVAGVREESLEIEREGMRPLPASLTTPAASASSEGRGLPGVVLVHGSGPHDRDSRVGNVAPFHDIAVGLSRAGIAVLRYEKRTKVEPSAFQGVDFTVDDEVTSDAVAAIQALKSVGGVDPKHLYVLGHSLGGALAPRIAARAGNVAGVILFAAPTRTVIALLSEQMKRLSEADGTVDVGEKAQLDAIDSMAKRLARSDSEPSSGELMGAPFSYWKSLHELTPIADVIALDCRALLVRGDADVQVPTEDWSRWSAALEHLERVTLRTYPGLDHFGAAASGEPTLGNEPAGRHVDLRLIDGIAEWIKEPSHQAC